MELFGPTFKRLRKSKGFTLKETAGTVVSVQFLSKFENGLCDITVSKFLALLNNINVSFEEIANEYPGESFAEVEQFEKKLSFYADTQNRYCLEGLAKEYLEKFQASGKEKYYHLAIITKRCYLGSECFSTEEQQLILNYLVSIDTWGYYEYFIYTCSIPFLGVEFITTTYPQLLKRMTAKPHKLDNHLIRPAALTFNSVFFLLKKRKISEAEQLINHFEQEHLFFHKDEFAWNALAEFSKGLVLYVKGQEEGQIICFKIIEAFNNVTGYHSFANALYSYFNEIKDFYQLV